MHVWGDINKNRPFPSSKKSHFESEAKCEAIDMKMIFNYDANKTHFHNKGFALSLVLKVRFFGTRKWPIVLACVAWRFCRAGRTNGEAARKIKTSFSCSRPNLLAAFLPSPAFIT